ncbi:MAG: IS66 family transposase [Methylibium sp.]|nr:IS66 family transposase [Methylibium sp.]MBA3624443.1 IS66 family transposase [Methylibium sp.]
MSALADENASLRAENRALRGQLAEREQEAHDLRYENDSLTTRVGALESSIERMRKRLFGWTSEQHHPGQQRLDLGAEHRDVSASDGAAADAATVASTGSMVTTDAATDAVTGSAAAATSAGPAVGASPTGSSDKGSRVGRHPGRRRLPADAEIQVSEIIVPDHERLDASGQPLPLLGYRTTDQWDYRPGTYLVRRFRRAIYGRPFSEAQDRIVAAMPPCLIPRGKMTDAALIHTVVDKFADHLPLYRQEQRAARVGIRLSRATLVGHVTAVARALAPVVEAIAVDVRAARWVHLDDTPVKLLDPGRGHTATARIWVYRSADAAVFRFTPTREGRHPAEFLGDYRGFIVADAYAGHERLYGPGRATPIGCWAHVRRKFHDIAEREPFALRMLDEIGRLYGIERELRLVDDDERRRARSTRATPLVTALRSRLDDARAKALPASDLGRAIAYAVTRWPTLTRYLEHGFLPIDNNPAENALRPWAVGRKNWLFFGSEAGGERAAIVATLIENCRMHRLDPFAYLLDTVAHLHRGCTDYAALTPRARAQAAAVIENSA